MIRSLSVIALAVVAQACGQAPSAESNEPKQPTAYEVQALEDQQIQQFGEEWQGDGSVIVYNASLVLTIPNPLNRGIRVLADGEVTLQGRLAPMLVSPAALSAHDQLAATRDYYLSVFGRNSYDGQGAAIRAAVDVQRYQLLDILGLRENAAWMGPFGHFIFGAGGDGLAGFAEATDVVAHEFTHAVISTTSNLRYIGQSGALNEHLADVFGEAIQHHYAPDSEPFLIGETVLRGELAEKARALRDMKQPSKGLVSQPAAMSEIPSHLGTDCQPARDNDNCGVHILSGIPNLAAALIIEQLGWEDSIPLFYRVMTERLTETSDFAEYREALISECRLALAAEQCDVIVDSFATVGL